MNKIIQKNKIFRFIIVGGSSTIIDFIIYMILNCFINVSFSKMISMTISCIYSFILNKNWTFQNKDNTLKIQIPIYVVSQIINILVNVFVNQIFFWLLNQKIVSYIIATFIAMIINYLLQNNIVFKEKK